MTFHEILLFIPVGLLMAVPFGPSNFLVFSNGLRYGPVPAGLAGVARIVAFGLLIGITAFGLGAMLSSAAWLLIGIKWFGIAYLAWLGIRIWRTPAPDVEALRLVAGAARPQGTLRALLRMEFTTAIANPKAILYFTAAFPQFIGPAENFTERFLTMGAVFLVCEYIVLWGYGLVGAGLGRTGLLAGMRDWINKITGASFLGFAAWMASAK
ncbi:LysE family translocator [Rhodospirillum rubrum]|uniref:Lysine exporter protein (LYSE/YGGA) n=1 Tax=Rhodospirillum rubrum (strain ATCC 11170 / ATH 1.1.1 / DSM 467 / LMG 4362 / NCIMB 8255 / S1) TaxID=269796 RepID=Q2RXL2_RHORT|nr:LysE family translocator [Rhodospirillum rubrum]ABC21133.1 Lysine exporter protein (LYSE/YGGA) [Rhodospirillum rubrum ATCC 11170]AEO46801.1 lysine exporter protein LysE/YggA [Rhodospirillum rubrum F11]MBK5952680.1 LysE family translocator [Rhodospirillum rubrum]QXG80825.1 LysE family translocator [Rhodospirillum rubrum]HCF18194.1 LysE family translocator [Rhodospirillum rubrum]